MKVYKPYSNFEKQLAILPINLLFWNRSIRLTQELFEKMATSEITEHEFETMPKTQYRVKPYSTPKQLLRLKPTVRRMEIYENMMIAASCINVTKHLKRLKELAEADKSPKTDEVILPKLYNEIIADRQYNEYGVAIYQTKADKARAREEQERQSLARRHEEYAQEYVRSLQLKIVKQFDDLEQGQEKCDIFSQLMQDLDDFEK